MEGGDFSFQIPCIAIGQRFVEQFLDDGNEVVQRPNRRESWRLRMPDQAAGPGQQQGVLDGVEGDVAVVELFGQTAVGRPRSRISRSIAVSMIGDGSASIAANSAS